MIIAIDGYSSSGKSTFAGMIARKMGLVHIDSGAMYRAVTLHAIQGGYISGGSIDRDKLIRDLETISIEVKYNGDNDRYETYLNGKNVGKAIRDVEVSRYVSEVSMIPEVRDLMVRVQRSIAEKHGVVMDGRDIGSVVLPHADIKIFLNAGADERARRRFRELKSAGMEVRLEEVRQNILHRDQLDTNRRISPLVKSPGAVELDNSEMSPEQEMEWFENLLRKYEKEKNKT